MSERDAYEVAEDARFDEDVDWADVDTMYIDGVAIPINSVQSTDLAHFDGKVTFGDYTQDSDQQTSAWIQTSWQGGALIGDQVPGATDSRFRWGNLWTFSPNQLSTNPKLEQVDLQWAASDAIFTYNGQQTTPIARWNGRLYVSSGTRLFRVTGTDVDPSTWTWTDIGALGGIPCGRGAVYGNPGEGTVRLWIPIYNQVAHAFALQTVDDDGITVNIHTRDDTHNTLSICTWDRRLMGLTSGSVYPDFSYQAYLQYYNMLGTWDMPDPYRRVSMEDKACRVVQFYDKSGDTTVFVASDRQMYVYDPDSDVLDGTSLHMPWAKNNGMAFNAWRDEAIYYGSEVGVRRYSSSGVMTPVGLDRDDGIPTDEYFPDAYGLLDFCPANNFMVGVIHAGSRLVDSVQTWRYHVVCYDETGWHILGSWDSIWDSQRYDLNFMNAYMSGMNLLVEDVVGGYRVWIGTRESTPTGLDGSGNYIARLYTISIPRGDYGPKQLLRNKVIRFESDGRQRTGWFDASMANFLKLNSHVVVTTEQTDESTDTMDGTVEIWYRLGATPDTWTQLGTVTTFGRTTLPFGIDADGFPRGVSDYKIELEYRIHSNDATFKTSPIIRSVDLKFIKLPLFARAWSVGVVLDSERMAQGLGPIEVDKFLATRLTGGPFNHIVIGQRHYRARVAQWQGREIQATGQKIGTLNLVGLQLTGYDIPDVEDL